MTQDEAIKIKKLEELKVLVEKTKKTIKDIEKGMNLGKKLGLNDLDLKPWKTLLNYTLKKEKAILGQIADIQGTCEHDFHILMHSTMFGTEIHYICKKCGYEKIEIDE